MLGLLRNIPKTSGKGSRVYVGLSGGVDSAVAAGLLKEQGYDVTGVFIKVWQPDFLPCTWRAERRDAMRVAAGLGIPFLFFDFEEEYKKGVADYMIEEYRRGRTPNPDVMCNREIKFGAFWKRAKEMGADYIATGHYLSGENDQRYFLWMLTPEDFSHALFPVGHMSKGEVRRHAKRFNLPVSEKKDSQGICFLGDVNMEDFLSRFISTEPGSVLDTQGRIIGQHKGALFYTLGQRYAKPLYVISKDLRNNTITVAEEPKKHMPKDIRIEQANWIVAERASRMLAQVRYKGEKVPVILDGDTVKFESPETAASGQSIVFYEGEELLGGAIIS
jgi:tRNA-uridine 2-sulfurtransferase